MRKKYFCLFLWLLCSGKILTSYADLPAWKILPKKSQLQFTAIQNNAPLSGEFKKFTGSILFDSQQLAKSHVCIAIDIASVFTSYQEIANTLKNADWFDVKFFPKAVFQSHNFIQLGKNHYQAKGILTLRDKSLPISINFTVHQTSPQQIQATGSAAIQRLDFGVGQGNWSKTDAVENKVQISFIINAVKQSFVN